MSNETQDAFIAQVRAALDLGGLVEPPDWVTQRAKRLFRARPVDASATVAARVRATLIFDSRRPTMASAGVRSAGLLEGPWQLLYRGDDVDVDLLVRPNQDGRTANVRGQALSRGAAAHGAGVVEVMLVDLPRQLHAPLEPAARSDVAPDGEFALANLVRGRYDVLLRFGAREIELMGLEL